MARTVAIGIQSFETIRKGNYFYIDKTAFIKEWWENGDSVTLIAARAVLERRAISKFTGNLSGN